MTEVETLEWTDFPMEEAATLVKGRRQSLLLPPAQPLMATLPQLSPRPRNSEAPPDSEKETQPPPKRPK
jgi:hypothetical protein